MRRSEASVLSGPQLSHLNNNGLVPTLVHTPGSPTELVQNQIAGPIPRVCDGFRFALLLSIRVIAGGSPGIHFENH